MAVLASLGSLERYVNFYFDFNLSFSLHIVGI